MKIAALFFGLSVLGISGAALVAASGTPAVAACGGHSAGGAVSTSHSVGHAVNGAVHSAAGGPVGGCGGSTMTLHSFGAGGAHGHHYAGGHKSSAGTNHKS